MYNKIYPSSTKLVFVFVSVYIVYLVYTCFKGFFWGCMEPVMPQVCCLLINVVLFWRHLVLWMVVMISHRRIHLGVSRNTDGQWISWTNRNKNKQLVGQWNTYWERQILWCGWGCRLFSGRVLLPAAHWAHEAYHLCQKGFSHEKYIKSDSLPTYSTSQMSHSLLLLFPPL